MNSHDQQNQNSLSGEMLPAAFWNTAADVVQYKDDQIHFLMPGHSVPVDTKDLFLLVDITGILSLPKTTAKWFTREDGERVQGWDWNSAYIEDSPFLPKSTPGYEHQILRKNGGNRQLPDTVDDEGKVIPGLVKHDDPRRLADGRSYAALVNILNTFNDQTKLVDQEIVIMKSISKDKDMELAGYRFMIPMTRSGVDGDGQAAFTLDPKLFNISRWRTPDVYLGDPDSKTFWPAAQALDGTAVIYKACLPCSPYNITLADTAMPAGTVVTSNLEWRNKGRQRGDMWLPEEQAQAVCNRRFHSSDIPLRPKHEDGTEANEDFPGAKPGEYVRTCLQQRGMWVLENGESRSQEHWVLHRFHHRCKTRGHREIWYDTHEQLPEFSINPLVETVNRGAEIAEVVADEAITTDAPMRVDGEQPEQAAPVIPETYSTPEDKVEAGQEAATV